MPFNFHFEPKSKQEQYCFWAGSPAGFRIEVCSGWHHALIMSEDHFKNPNGSWSGSGPFFVWKRDLKHMGKKDVRIIRNNNDQTYTCIGVEPGPYKPNFPPALPTWTSEEQILQSLYAKGYARAKPGAPVANLGQFIIELKDLPSMPFRQVHQKKIPSTRIPLSEAPRVLHKRLKEYRDLGSEYLNYAFGWKPFVSDIRKVYNLSMQIDKQMAQLVRENGRGVTRKATVQNDDTSVQNVTEFSTAYANVIGAPPNYFGSYNVYDGTGSGSYGRTTYTRTRREVTKVWFEGTFRYYIPDIGTSQWDRRARLALFGLHPSPELLWEVLPWSWLIDYFSNVGDVMSNMSTGAAENLTVSRSFIMRHTIVETEHKAHVVHESLDAPGYFNNKWPRVEHTWSTVDKTETKSRAGGGNPFGLNVTLDSLNANQLAILAALGISRSQVR